MQSKSGASSSILTTLERSILSFFPIERDRVSFLKRRQISCNKKENKYVGTVQLANKELFGRPKIVP